MRRLTWFSVAIILAMAGQALAQQAASVESLRDKQTLTDTERQQVRVWLQAAAAGIVAATDTENRGMISARENILNEVRRDVSRSPAYLQVVGEETVAVFKDAEKKAVSQAARVNMLMVVSEMRRLEAVPMLEAALAKDPYPASRYWAARGLNLVADVVVEKIQPRVEAEMADSVAKILDTESSSVVLYQVFEMLGKFDNDRARDVLAEGVVKVAPRLNAADAVSAQLMNLMIAGLEKAYSRDSRPAAKIRAMDGFATLCAWVMPPVADSNVMFGINASLEKITGEKVGFQASDSPVMQKMALVEWVEKLLRDKKISKRPTVPAAIEEVVKDMTDAAK